MLSYKIIIFSACQLGMSNMKKVLLITLLLFGCYNKKFLQVEKKMNKYEWLIDNQQPKAIVVLAHGLNIKPDKMDDWAKIFTNASILRIGLSGHYEELENMQDIQALKWQEDFMQAMKLALEKSKFHNVPLYFLGFSLGGLLGIDWQENNISEHNFQKMVLIAPALRIPWYSSSLIKFVSFFSSKALITSRTPKDYRANNKISLSAYKALYEIKNNLDKKGIMRSNVPTLVIMDKNDELIPVKEIKSLFNEYRLNNWRLEIVNNKFAYDNYGFRHLLVDENSVGKELWSILTAKVLEHFSL